MLDLTGSDSWWQGNKFRLGTTGREIRRKLKKSLVGVETGRRLAEWNH